MEQLGNLLREERLKQGKTLEDIARTTRISRVTLQTIESGSEDEKLPPASYLRGFIKLYAQELGLDAEELLEGMPKQTAGGVRVALPRSVDLDEPRRPVVKIILITLLLCVGCLWAWHAFFGFDFGGETKPGTIVSPRPAVVESPAVEPGQPAADEGAREISAETPAAEDDEDGQAPPEAPAAAEGFTVKFAARGIVWLKLQPDGGETVDITLRKRERYSISAEKELQVRLGNPAMVDVWYNDAPVALGGTPGLPIDMTFPDSVLQSEQRED